MKYSKLDAKDYARENMKGIWAAALNPFKPDGAFDEAGLRQNIRHWVDDLDINGLFIAGKQGEFFSMSLDERKTNFEIAVEECNGKAATIMSASDQNFDTVVELAKHAQDCGADYVVVHAPILHFVHDQDDTVFNYYKQLCDKVDIGIAMWSHPDSGYLMSPELCARVAELPNIVAIKYSVPREMYVRLTQMVGDKIQVSTASEEEWLDNIEELDWKLYLCSAPPYLLQTKNDKRMKEYTDLAFAGKFDEARKVRDSLDPVRQAIKSTRPGGKPQAHSKYWQELLGQVGGPVRSPLLQLTEEEKERTKAAFDSCGLKL
ncbi:dihydrodipicolinate synthase family protein [Albibacillus kandeliae]|uniref:dihydrodipicolinate synthase family protein n=1 Tax=Albibacillus kandeliae TaxID=2174228 RepID=UPI000D699679|nr:dihydrodipicolinate synthase family protein [Albibacillus kandeliae]